MEALIPIVALIMVFGPFFYAIKRRYDLKELEAGRGVDPKLLEQLKQERKLLQGRIENLESIVCETDHELNLRIAHLALEQTQMQALPSASNADASQDAGPGASENASDDANPPSGSAGAPSKIHATGPTLTAAGLEPRTPAQAISQALELSLDEVLAERYRIVRLLGRGGMGAVYLAHDEVLHEDVALKVISSAWAHDRRAMVERFRRETAAARKVSSPNVIRIHDIGEAGAGVIYISMEFFDGHTLSSLITDRGRLGKRDTRQILGQVCDGLSAAHDAGVIHRDLKPQNVLVSRDETVKIIDFGLAKTALGPAMTATGLMMGTPFYMSPEQVRGGEVDVRSDIYSLGALSYHAVTGQPPFAGDNPIAIGFAHLTETAARPRELNAAVSKELDDMIMDALAKAPEDRPQTAEAFRKAV